MKGLYKYLSPFAPDYSGAVSVLFELGGMIVVCDAGGCTGNICGYDEPRWYNSKSALFSAGLRDLDTIFGRDDTLLDKIADAASQIDCDFLAFIGTPVSAVIGTDFKALAQLAQKRTDLPVLAVDTNGMDLYDKGQEAAYLSLFQTFAADYGGSSDASKIGIIGATPLDLPDYTSRHLVSLLQGLGFGKPVCYGMGTGLSDIKMAGAACCNLVVSPSGLKAARWLRERFGTPYVTGLPFSEADAMVLQAKIQSAITGAGVAEGNSKAGSGKGGLLIVHQQITANAVRDYVRKTYQYNGNVDVASWFMLDKELTENGDNCLYEEDDLHELLTEKQYRMVVGDPLFKRAISGWQGEYITLPHYAVSGSLFNQQHAADFLEDLHQCFASR